MYACVRVRVGGRTYAPYLVWLLKGIHKCVGEVSPLVIMADVSKVDMWSNTQGYPQPSTLPGDTTQTPTRDTQGVVDLGKGHDIIVMTS